MFIPNVSDHSLRLLHDTTRQAFDKDEANPSAEKEYGVRSYPDWKQWADMLEAEMTKRGLPFTPIPW